MKKIYSFIVLILLISPVFAYDQIQATFWQPLMGILNFFTSIWFILPILAGKLLTNDFVYGSFMHLDVILWKIWNFSRTVANFLIGFIFVFAIFKYLVSVSDKNISVLKTYLPKVALGTLIVNSSWFLIWVLIDISTLLIAAFGSLPASISSDIYKLGSEQNMTISTHWTIVKWCNSQEEWCIWGYKIIENHQKDVPLQDLLSYEASISWPLMFLGDSFFNINQFRQKIQKEWFSNDEEENFATWARMRFFLQLIIILLFLVPMFILVIINLVRIFWLRIYIWFSPLIFLDQIFWWKVWQKVNKAFSFSNMIWLIFQPALVVLAFSIGFIFISIFINVILWKNTGYNDKVRKTFWIVNADNWKIIAKTFMMQDESANFSEYVWWFFGYLIWSFLVIAIVWWLIKLSFKASEVTSWIAEGVYTFTEWALKSVKFIPTPFGAQSIGSLKQLWSYIERIPTDRAWRQASNLEKYFHTVVDLQPRKLREYESVLSGLNSSSTINSLDKDKIDEMFEYLNRYSWKEASISSNKNAKKLLSDIENTLRTLSSHITDSEERTKINDLLRNLENFSSDYQKKLSIILNNQELIKKVLKKE